MTAACGGSERGEPGDMVISDVEVFLQRVGLERGLVHGVRELERGEDCEGRVELPERVVPQRMRT